MLFLNFKAWTFGFYDLKIFNWSFKAKILTSELVVYPMIPNFDFFYRETTTFQLLNEASGVRISLFFEFSALGKY